MGYGGGGGGWPGWPLKRLKTGLFASWNCVFPYARFIFPVMYQTDIHRKWSLVHRQHVCGKLSSTKNFHF